MPTGLWIEDARRKELERIFSEYTSARSILDMKDSRALCWQRKMLPGPEMAGFLLQAGISPEEYIRFGLWLVDEMTLQMMSGGNQPPIDRFKEGEAEYLVCRALGMPKQKLFRLEVSSLESLSLVLDFFSQIASSGRVMQQEAYYQEMANRIGVGIDDLVDAMFLVLRRVLEFLRDQAIRGPLIPAENADQFANILFSREPAYA